MDSLGIFLSLVFLVVTPGGATTDDIRGVTSSYGRVMSSSLAFSMDCYRQLSRDDPLNNVVFSPLSVYSTLLVTLAGARNRTAEEIGRVLHVLGLNTTSVQEIFGEMVRNLLKDPTIRRSLNVANALFVHFEVDVSREYIDSIRHKLDVDVRKVDFTNGSLAKSVINEWIGQQTRDVLGNFLGSAPGRTTRILVCNALYFSGEWVWQLNPGSKGFDSLFFTSPYTFMVADMMEGTLFLNYGHSDEAGASILELPYKGGRIIMLIVLPDKMDGLQALEGSLDEKLFQTLLSTTEKSEVKVRIPRVNIEYASPMTNALWHMGIRDLFSPRHADMGVLSPNQPRLHVNEVVHRVFFNMDEKGSLAAASTAISVQRVGLSGVRYFDATHPFLYFILDKQTGLVLFLGRVVRP